MSLWISFSPYLYGVLTAGVLFLLVILICGFKPDFGLNRYYVFFLLSIFGGILLVTLPRLISNAYLWNLIFLFIMLLTSRLLSKGPLLLKLLSILSGWTFVAFGNILFGFSPLPAGEISAYNNVSANLLPFLIIGMILALTSVLRKQIHALSILDLPLQIAGCLLLLAILVLELSPVSEIVPYPLFLGALLLLSISILASFVFYRLWKQSKEEAKDIYEMNHMLEESYAAVVSRLEQQYAEAHDYKNHLRILRELDEADAHEHIDRLLGKNSFTTKHCHSRDRYVNAILNCKLDEAAIQGIQATFSVMLSKPLPIPSTDICAVLGNQMDNAIDACRKINDPKKRQIHIVIEENMDFIAFIVKNTIVPNSLSPSSDLATSKEDPEHPHGLGLHNIRYVAEKHGGSLTNTIQEDAFISTVILQV